MGLPLAMSTQSPSRNYSAHLVELLCDLSDRWTFDLWEQRRRDNLEALQSTLKSENHIYHDVMSSGMS